MDIRDEDIVEAIQYWTDNAATWVIANYLKRRKSYNDPPIKTRQVLSNLKRMERSGKVVRNNSYSQGNSYVWSTIRSSNEPAHH